MLLVLRRHADSSQTVLNKIITGKLEMFTLLDTTGKFHVAYKVFNNQPKVNKYGAIPASPYPSGFNILAKFEGNRFKHIGYISGTIFMPNKSSDTSKKECILFGRFWLGMIIKQVPTNIELWHPFRCIRCKRKLTDPDSIRIGMGPRCTKLSKKEVIS